MCNGLADDIYKFGAVLSELESFLETWKYNLLAVVGDFNVEVACADAPRTSTQRITSFRAVY